MTGVRPTSSWRASELALRVFSALVLIAIALAASWAGGLPFQMMCAAGALLILAEFLSMTADSEIRWGRAFAFAVLIAAIMGWFIHGAALALTIALVCALALAIIELIGRQRAWLAAGIAYAILPFLALVLLRGETQAGLLSILVLFACVWGADTAAYFAGRAIGGPKLAPAISPNKTWSGFIGGILGAIVAALAIAFIFGSGAGIAGTLLAMLLAVAAAMGDLLESWIKRKFKRKDSGTLIPGHGGVLDRIDGLVAAAVVAWVVGGLAMEPGLAGESFSRAFLLP